ncbi:heterokaryon incompatibility protein-domain-containing protein [Staphylotrichum tortipilum]|uniref:Heterokaryon incompatibility protein-domain-containing protein n=1 Tax=Staphylotrichum tortipilum TaxID=2831512 RepID=A0AAN6MNZ1_9PEZI|nr:heterokaryon incompatibility protein-domain-containing protein [Staphylotrichum longicolle]
MASENTTPFAYPTRLLPNEIRLLTLHPASQDHPTLLNLHLTTVTLPAFSTPAPPSYLALSYAWGDPTPPLPLILLNSCPHPITPNLQTALTLLSRRELCNPAQQIWIDALCINQDDPLEKHAQIPLMGRIYSLATQVVVFLGAGSGPATERVFRQMDRVGGMVLRAGAMVFREADLREWPDFEGCEGQEGKREVRRKLEGIMDRESGGVVPGIGKKPGLDGEEALRVFGAAWFERAWVVQEICLAREGEGKVVFACGEGRVLWERMWAAHLFLALWVLREGGKIGEPRGRVERWWRVWVYKRRTGMGLDGFSSRAAKTLGTRKKYLQGDLRRDLKGLLILFYVADLREGMKCRDPEDRVLAIRAMARDGDMLDSIVTPHATWQQVYTSLSRHFYREGDLDFLSLCRCRNDESNLPSWVTDWTVSQRVPWLEFKHGLEAPLFDAGKGTTTRICETDDNTETLCLEGFPIDTIRDVGSTCVADVDDDLDWDAARVRILEIDRFLSSSELYTPAEEAAARWRIFVADRVTNHVGEYVRATDTDGWAEESFSKMEAITTSSSLLGVGSFGSWYFSYRNAVMTLWSSRPFVSCKGYVGLCPSTAKVGDTVFIPSGSHCPYVISHTDKTTAATASSKSSPVPPDAATEKEIRCWKLLGEAYVHGIMDGELDLGSKTAEALDHRLV